MTNIFVNGRMAEDGSLFYYVDTNDFRPVAFGGPEPVQTQMIQL